MHWLYIVLFLIAVVGVPTLLFIGRDHLREKNAEGQRNGWWP